MTLTEAGQVLVARCGPLLSGLDDALTFTAGIAGSPKGTLSISAGIGFGVNVLGAQLPAFLARYPDIHVSIDLTSRNAELIAERVDVAIRMGPLPDSGLVATRLGTLTQYLCATPAYLDRAGRPDSPADLAEHQLIDFPGNPGPGNPGPGNPGPGNPGPGNPGLGNPGRVRPWRPDRDDADVSVEPATRVEVNDALTICALVGQGAGIGVISAYLCGAEIREGTLERVLPEWSVPPLPVHMLFPSRRELAPTVRAFVDFMREVNVAGEGWLADPLSHR